MRTANDFNRLYAEPDPWKIASARFRDKMFRTRLSKFIRDKSVLELGCGEGHLTATAFQGATAVKGIDISDVAIERAKALGLPYAQFQVGDFMSTSFAGYDVIAALECLYYLSQEEQQDFFSKVGREHKGKVLLVSGPIIGQRHHSVYFTHSGLLETFARHGFSVIEYRNMYTIRNGPVSNVASALLVRLPLTLFLMDLLPETFIYQRLYAVTKA